MRKLSPLQKMLISIIAILMSVTLILNVIQSTRPTETQMGEGVRFYAQVQYALVQRPLYAITSFVQDVSTLWSTMEENKKLREQIDLIATYQSRLEEAYRDIEDLKQLNQLSLSLSEASTISATVIQRSMDSFTHSIILDVGSNDGIELGDAVISNLGLLGKVVEVSEKTSVVLLLTTELDINKISVKIQIDPTKTSEAILERYDPNTKSYSLKLLDTNSSITTGMKVITSAAGGLFPSGLLVGVVNHVETLPNTIGLKILVTPAADFYDLNYVLIVKRGSSE